MAVLELTLILKQPARNRLDRRKAVRRQLFKIGNGKGKGKSKPLSRGDRCFFAVLDETILAHGKEHRVHGDSPVVRAVSREVVRKEFARRYVEDGSGNAGSGERSAWKRAFDNAMTAGSVGGEQFNVENALIWRV